MQKSIFFIWLNDTFANRHYWSEQLQTWTIEFDKATKFPRRFDAEGQAEIADTTTKAEVIVQEMYL